MTNHQEGKLKTYPKMTAFKSFKNSVIQKIIRIIGKFLRRHTKLDEHNVYHKIIYRPADEAEIYQFNITGEIPQHLNGMLLRIGSNPIYVQDPSLFDWYLGDGMIHGLKLQNGQPIWFKSTMIATDSIQKYKKRLKIRGYRRGAHDVVNTNIFRHAGELWAVIAAGTFPVCLDDELVAQRYQLFNSDADLPFTAHPRKDIKTGHLHAISYDVLDIKNAYYQVIDEQGHLIHLTQILLKHGPIIHDCLITEHDIIIFDFPLTFSKKHLLKGKTVPYCWNDQHQARIGILGKYQSAEMIEWIEIDPCYVFHAANAYQDDAGQIIMDVLVHDTEFEHSQQAAYEHQHAKLERWIVNSQRKNLQRIILDARIQEFPKIDMRFTGFAYRYLYTLSFPETGLFNFLIIHDLVLNQSVTHNFGEKWAIGEVSFIAEYEQSPEGHGYLMMYLHHLEGEASKVVMIKVNGLEIQEQAEIDLGVRVPLGFHCNWVNLNSE